MIPSIEQLVITILLSWIVGILLRRLIWSIIREFPDSCPAQQPPTPQSTQANESAEVFVSAPISPFSSAPAPFSTPPLILSQIPLPSSRSSSTSSSSTLSPSQIPLPSSRGSSVSSSSSSTTPSQIPLPPSCGSSISSSATSSSSSSSSTQSLPLSILDLPVEVRVKIYQYYFASYPIHIDFVDQIDFPPPPPNTPRSAAELQDRHHRLPHHCARTAPSLSLLYTSRLIRQEATPFFFTHTTFVFHQRDLNSNPADIVDLCIPTQILPLIQHIWVAGSHISWPDTYLPNEIIQNYNLNPRTVHVIAHDMVMRPLFGGSLPAGEKAYLKATPNYQLTFELNAIKAVPSTNPARPNLTMTVDRPWARFQISADREVRLVLRADHATIPEIQTYVDTFLGLDLDRFVVDDDLDVLQVTERARNSAQSDVGRRVAPRRAGGRSTGGRGGVRAIRTGRGGITRVGRNRRRNR